MKYNAIVDASGQSYTQIAKNLGISRNAIYVMRKQQSEKFKFIKDLDPEFEKGFRKYRAMQREVVDELQSIYYVLSDRRLLSAFSGYLCGLGIYGSPLGWSYAVSKGLFKFDITGMAHSGLLRRSKVIQAYKIFKKDYDVEDYI